MTRILAVSLAALVLVVASCGSAEPNVARPSPQEEQVKKHYKKYEYWVPARDGVKLYVNAYVPRDKPGKHPILMERTPYHAEPYGADTYPGGFQGSKKYQDAGYIFAFSDARGSGMSEGDFPSMANPETPLGSKGVDESTDSYDVIDYLVKHVPDNNGNVGIRGISYPGYYAAAAGINNHPALKAISPQAPCANWFMGDDVHHNGAFFLQDLVGFLTFFGPPRTELGKWGTPPQFDTGPDAYDFYLKTGALPNFEKNDFKGKIRFWPDLMAHPDYDDYWKTTTLPMHMDNVKCAVLVVGGWFDAEDQWGAVHLPDAILSKNPDTPVFRVMGPWFHGMWAGPDGSSFGDLDYGTPTTNYFQDEVEFPFFDKYLRDGGEPAPAYATMFETGRNRWHQVSQWPPAGVSDLHYYLGSNKQLSKDKSTGDDAYTYDPAAPTPYIPDYKTSTERPITYMVDDQRFAEKRKDVVTYETPALENDVTVAGPIDADIWFKTTGTDADIVVKVIDVYPDDMSGNSHSGKPLAGYEQLLKGDIFRTKYRNSFEKPEAITPGEPTEVHFKLNDCYHTFLKGHRLMVQVQSAWFPLVDRNSNSFEDLYTARDSDFKPATISILHDADHASSIGFDWLPQGSR
jgi:putative CocE/NonD family hydrolase